MVNVFAWPNSFTSGGSPIVEVRVPPTRTWISRPTPVLFQMQLLIAVIEWPRSGTAYGSGTELPPPPV